MTAAKFRHLGIAGGAEWLHIISTRRQFLSCRECRLIWKHHPFFFRPHLLVPPTISVTIYLASPAAGTYVVTMVVGGREMSQSILVEEDIWMGETH